jgi:hypothetical protein
MNFIRRNTRFPLGSDWNECVYESEREGEGMVETKKRGRE